MNEELQMIEEETNNLVKGGLTLEIMEIKPSVENEIIDALLGRCPPAPVDD